MMTSNFGSRLKALRKKTGITQPELANLIGVHETTIRRWENGNDIPLLKFLPAIAKALGVPEADLLNDPPPKTGGWVLNIRTVVDFEQEVVDLTANTSNVSNLSLGPAGASLTITGDWETWLDPVNLKKLLKQIQNAQPIIENAGAGFGHKKI